MITLDAQSKKIGRIASQAASFLMGKDLPTFKVHIINASKAYLTEKKLQSLIYSRYSGYPGGLKKESGKNLLKRRGASQLFRVAISGMLPKNRLKKNMLKRLTISE